MEFWQQRAAGVGALVSTYKAISPTILSASLSVFAAECAPQKSSSGSSKHMPTHTTHAAYFRAVRV